VALDLGAIGKGFALDLAASVLRDWDVGSALLNAGGSTALAVGDEPWLVGAGGPWGAQVGRDAVRLANASLSGSGFEVKGLHIVDPRTGLASQRHRAAWAMAPTGALSDAYSTAFLVMDTTAVEACCRNQPGLSALVVEPGPTDQDDLVVATTGFDACTGARP
jgi:thiamine biosynthesis lipoprotein